MAGQHQENDRLSSRWLARPVVFTAVLAAYLGIATAAISSPLLNWDMVGYVGVIMSYLYYEKADIHEKAYLDVAAVAPQPRFRALIGEASASSEENRYLATMFRDPESFVQNTYFYAIRPLYLALVYLASLALGNVAYSTFFVSAGCMMMLNIVVLVYLSRKIGALNGSTFALLLATFAPLLEASRLSSPDALLAVLFTISLVCLLEGKTVLGCTVLLVATFARTDVVLYNLLLAIAIALWNGLDRTTKILAMAILLSSALAAYGIQMMAGYPGYEVLYAHTFIGWLNYPLDWDGESVGVLNRLRYIAIGIKAGLYDGHLWLVGLATMTFLYAHGTSWFYNAWHGLMASTLVLFTILRTVLFPNTEDRYYLTVYIGLYILSIVSLSGGAAARLRE